MTKDPDTLDYDEAAAFLGVNRRTLERMVHDGEVPSIPVRARRTFSKRQLTAWKDERASESVKKSRKTRNAVLSLVNV